MTTYEAFPLQVSPQRSEILSEILDRTAESDNLWVDRDFPDFESRRQYAIQVLSKPDTFPLEVWRFDEESDGELAGILYFTDVSVRDAKCHFLFFDGTLGADKVKLMERGVQWAFEDHEDLGWIAKSRLTAEVPEYAFALARFVHQKLDFGGPFERTVGDKVIEIEGVRRNALMYQSEPADMLVMGRLRESDNDSDSE